MLFCSPCPHLVHILTRLIVLLQGQRGFSSHSALDQSSDVEAMEEEEGEGPVAVREGPSGHGVPLDSSSSTATATTNNLLASVKEQVKTPHTDTLWFF